MRSWWVDSDCKGTKTDVSSVLQVGRRFTAHGCTNKLALSDVAVCASGVNTKWEVVEVI